jgi:hypothetical protein
MNREQFIAKEGCNPDFWLEAITTNAHCTDCWEKRQALLRAEEHLRKYIAFLEAKVRGIECGAQPGGGEHG